MTRVEPVRFGLAGLCAQSPSGTAWEFQQELRQLLAVSQIAEDEQLDSLWLSEHHFSDDCYLPSVVPVLGALAQETERVTLSTNVALAPMYHALRLAEDCAVIDHLSHGRFMIGLGLGYREIEFDGLGVDRRQRGSLMGSTIDTLKRAWAGKPVAGTSGGREVVVTPPPYREEGPPVLVGALAEIGIRRAAAHANGWIAPLLSQVAHADRRLGWLMHERNGDLDGFHVALTFTGFIGAEGAWQRVANGALNVESQYRRWMQEADEFKGLRNKPIDFGSTPGGPPEHFVCGTPDEVYERLAPWVHFLHTLPSAAIPHVAFRLTWPSTDAADNAESVRLFAREVVPRLREL